MSHIMTDLCRTEPKFVSEVNTKIFVRMKNALRNSIKQINESHKYNILVIDGNSKIKELWDESKFATEVLYQIV